MGHMHAICNYDNLGKSLTNIWAEHTHIIITVTGLSSITSCVIYITTQPISFMEELKV